PLQHSEAVLCDSQRLPLAHSRILPRRGCIPKPRGAPAHPGFGATEGYLFTPKGLDHWHLWWRSNPFGVERMREQCLPQGALRDPAPWDTTPLGEKIAGSKPRPSLCHINAESKCLPAEHLLRTNGRTNIFLNVLDDAAGAFEMGDVRPAGGVVHGVGHIAD